MRDELKLHSYECNFDGPFSITLNSRAGQTASLKMTVFSKGMNNLCLNSLVLSENGWFKPSA